MEVPHPGLHGRNTCCILAAPVFPCFPRNVALRSSRFFRYLLLLVPCFDVFIPAYHLSDSHVLSCHFYCFPFFLVLRFPIVPYTFFEACFFGDSFFFSSPFSLLTSFPSPCSAFPPFVIRRLHSVVCSWFFCPSQSSMELPETNVCLSLSIRVFVSEPEGSVPMNAVIIHPSGSSSGSILRKNSKNKSITLPQQVPSALQRVPHLRQ